MYKYNYFDLNWTLKINNGCPTQNESQGNMIYQISHYKLIQDYSLCRVGKFEPSGGVREKNACTTVYWTGGKKPDTDYSNFGSR